MDSSTQNEYSILKTAKNEIESILIKYDLCGFYVLSNQNYGTQEFSYRNYSGMKWEVDDDGCMIGTYIELNMKQHDIDKTLQKLTNCYVISEYFATILFNQAEHMQQVNDDLVSAYNLDRNKLKISDKQLKTH